jgi:hypothetical protein
MSERRIDIFGRDVTDLPGLWSDEDKVIPAKPEAMEIDNAFRVEVGSSGQLFQILQPGPPDDVGDVVIGNAIEARQLADWLTRFADWREAQE